MKARLSRRQFLAGCLASTAAAAGAWTFFERERPLRGTVLSAFEDAVGDQYVGGLNLDEHRVFGARVPARAHGCAIDPIHPDRVLFFARRPGTEAFELDRASMQVRTVFATGPGRHLSGHGLFSPDGSLLLVPEYEYESARPGTARGIVTVRDAQTFRIVQQLDTRGIDPHEIAWRPDGRTILVANGGILTHPRSFRRKLNIATMDPSLCVIDVASGECREQWRLEDHLLSIRHIAVAADGSAAVGLQYEGRREDAPAVAALYRPGKGLALLRAPAQQTRRFAGYVASVASSEEHDVIAAACPYGGGVACWSLREQRYLGFIAAAELYGVSRLADGSLLASQRDGSALELDETRLRADILHFQTAGPIRWDDHWVATA